MNKGFDWACSALSVQRGEVRSDYLPLLRHTQSKEWMTINPYIELYTVWSMNKGFDWACSALSVQRGELTIYPFYSSHSPWGLGPATQSWKTSGLIHEWRIGLGMCGSFCQGSDVIHSLHMLGNSLWHCTMKTPKETKNTNMEEPFKYDLCQTCAPMLTNMECCRKTPGILRRILLGKCLRFLGFWPLKKIYWFHIMYSCLDLR